MPNHPGLEYTKMEMDVFYGAITHVFAHTPGFYQWISDSVDQNDRLLWIIIKLLFDLPR